MLSVGNGHALRITGRFSIFSEIKYCFNFYNMERPNQKYYDFNDAIEGVRFAKDVINYADYMEKQLRLYGVGSSTYKITINDGFVIDFFELMFLSESVIPERPIARSICFDDFSERHYHKMNDNQRLQFFEHVQNCHGFTLENEQCRHFFARFNPKNQYLVSCFHNSKSEAIQCYMFDEEYRTSKNRFVNRDYIKSCVRLHDSQAII